MIQSESLDQPIQNPGVLVLDSGERWSWGLATISFEYNSTGGAL
jgi:hypothetical protein